MRQFLYKLKSDESLMMAYCNGNTEAFEVLYTRHKDRLFAFLYRNCQQASIVEELAQDAWMSLINHAQRYQPTASFKTYLYQIAHNKLRDYWRKSVAREDHHITGESAQPMNNNEQMLENEQLHNCISHALGQLPIEQRDVFLLREEGFSRQAIAEITGASTETVKSRLRYAVNQLRTQLEGANG